MPPTLAKYLEKQLGSPVNHCGMIGEIRRGAHKTAQLKAADHAIQITIERICQLRHQIECGRTRRLLTLLNRQIQTNDALMRITPINPWHLP